MRRDATINALFYNLQTERIEDFTGRGLSDMANRIIRTPLAAYQTFKDDPLRTLRLIRFASRLDYTIEPTSLEAMRDKTIHEALRAKISRERVGIEVDKMLTGPGPQRALELIFKLNLHGPVFANPFYQTEFDFDQLPTIYDGLHRATSIASGLFQSALA